MSRAVLVLFGQFFAIVACVLVWMANQSLTVGFGINPWIAIPVATVLLMVIPVLAERYDSCEESEEEATLRIKVDIAREAYDAQPDNYSLSVEFRNAYQAYVDFTDREWQS